MTTIIYRVAKAKYIRDLSGKGTESHGGRWSPKGYPVVYASESRSLAALEFLGRVRGLVPGKQEMPLSFASIEVPISIVQEIQVKNLPKDWRCYPAPAELQNVGLQWINAGTFLLLKVPSVHILQECNILINPRHPGMVNVKIVDIEPFHYDPRLAKSDL